MWGLLQSSTDSLIVHSGRLNIQDFFEFYKTSNGILYYMY